MQKGAAETQRFAVPSPPLRLPAAHGHLDAAGHLPASPLQGHHHSPHVFPGLPRTNSPAPKALSDRALCAPQRPPAMLGPALWLHQPLPSWTPSTGGAFQAGPLCGQALVLLSSDHLTSGPSAGPLTAPSPHPPRPRQGCSVPGQRYKDRAWGPSTGRCLFHKDPCCSATEASSACHHLLRLPRQTRAQLHGEAHHLGFLKDDLDQTERGRQSVTCQ